jgi:two-component system sensor histidine kinase ChvG
MASAIDTARPDRSDGGDEREPTPLRRRPGFFASRLGRLIFFLNLLSLLILITGALILNELRRGLVETRLQSLTAQGELIANLIESTATRGYPEPALDPMRAGIVLQENFIRQGQRARLFDADAALLADSYVFSEDVEVRPLPPVGERRLFGGDSADKEAKRIEKARADLEKEVEAALDGVITPNVRRAETGDEVISVSIPIQRVKSVLGVLTLEAGDVDEIVAAQRNALLPFALVALGVTLFTSVLLHLFIARPVLRLAAAADQVRLSRARAISLPDLEERSDEIGDLARSLETMTATLSKRMDAIERFAADVSHEIKNPLTSIRSAVETLGLVKDDAAKARLTNLLMQDVRRLDRLITDISNASRLDAELSRDHPRVVEIGRLLKDIVGLYGETQRAADPQVRFEEVDELEPLQVNGREGPLGQVFRNLVDNARSFSPPGGTVLVRLERSRDDPSRPVRVTVEDDGPGVPPDNLETIFERFYTSRPKGHAFGGNSGLGLSIARQIVEAHGGRIWAENRLDGNGAVTGARFLVTLPERGS